LIKEFAEAQTVEGLKSG
jgi:CubicO group peptidase (beta-lactamase class C family)